MVQVKLSDKPCLFCSKAAQTVSVKAKEHDFQGSVCGEHLFNLLKKWEKPEEKVA